MKSSILIVNLGTPEKPNIDSVNKYLLEFLLDPRVIEKNVLARHLLVRGFIVPKRKQKVAESYRTIWTNEGSPLLVHSIRLQNKMQELLGKDFSVHLAMRYPASTIDRALDAIRSEQPKEIICLPLFPHYASATTGSIFEYVMKKLSGWRRLPKITFIDEFSTFTPYIHSLSASLEKQPLHSYDHIIFSFHGLPKSPETQTGYATSCLATAEAVARKTALPSWSIAFQSRLGKEEWLRPYLIDEVKEHARSLKKILIISPSFVADCLETLYELGREVHEDFLAAGGKKFDIVPCLNETAAYPLVELLGSKIQ